MGLMSTTPTQINEQRKKDAYEFALLLYDIFQEEELNGSVDDDQNNKVHTSEDQSCLNDPQP